MVKKSKNGGISSAAPARATRGRRLPLAAGRVSIPSGNECDKEEMAKLLKHRRKLLSDVRHLEHEVQCLRCQLDQVVAEDVQEHFVIYPVDAHVISKDPINAHEIILTDVTADVDVCSALSTCTKLRKLSLTLKEGDCDLQQLAGVRRLERLRVAFPYCGQLIVPLTGGVPMVKSLRLHGDCVDNASARGVCRIDTLEELLIAGSKRLTDLEDICRLANLKVLDLTGTSVDDNFVKRLSGCRELVALSLADSQEVNDVTPLSHMAKLETLVLRHCRWVNEGFGSLGSLSTLRLLNLRFTQVNDRSVERICASLSLVSLELSYCDNVTDISPLHKLAGLEELGIAYCRNISTGWDVFGCLPRLRVLNAAETPVNESILDEILKASGITTLSITCEGAANADSIANLTLLEDVKLSCCNFRGNNHPFAALQRLRVAEASVRMYDGVLREICYSKSITKLVVRKCEYAYLKHLTSLKSLVELHLYETSLNEEAYVFAELPQLRVLVVVESTVSCDSLVKICNCRSLESLTISCVTDLRYLPPFAKMTALRELKLKGACEATACPIGLIGLPQLRALTIEGMHIIGDGLDAFSGPSHLEALSILNCEGMCDVTALLGLTALEELRLRSCKWVKDGLGTFAALPRLRVLDLSGTCSSDEYIRELCMQRLKEEASQHGELSDAVSLSRVLSLNEMGRWCSEGAKQKLNMLKIPKLSWVSFEDVEFSPKS
ncbi:unnamed protein product [Trypanosoma congolense IL3000]|uniref:WGS project CAEQ00000000 data, annotated contig 994 n=1 Tax=Trypanosoma congolense (strain IL3000) TaxID=1068625 RepID=F9WK69_TRYCI|nr:unnamed protein product [Trypanosoma congolense IL3000]